MENPAIVVMEGATAPVVRWDIYHHQTIRLQLASGELGNGALEAHTEPTLWAAPMQALAMFLQQATNLITALPYRQALGGNGT